MAVSICISAREVHFNRAREVLASFGWLIEGDRKTDVDKEHPPEELSLPAKKHGMVRQMANQRNATATQTATALLQRTMPAAAIRCNVLK